MLISRSRTSPSLLLLSLVCILLALPVTAHGQRKVTSPRQQFGFEIGDDYQLANYRQLVEYWTLLDRESSRMKLVPIGPTEEGRTQVVAVVSAPANIRRVDQYRDITRRLALAEDLTDAQARKLARDGRTIVMIAGGLHGSETLGAQQLIETVYQLVSRNDPETRRILNEVIVLAVLANPDGMDLVVDWYMREPEPQKRVTGGYPRLYQKYAGHDNNRDFYAVTQAETKNMCRVMFREWFPQIVYDHHQSGPPGSVMFAPPFRDPFNYRIDPRVITGIDAVGSAMMSRFLAEDKPGVTMRSGARYSTWWNGGLRSISYFHNMMGLLTETIGSPTPISIPFDPKMQLPRGDLPAPVQPQSWPFRKSVEYSLTANYAVLDYAARNREHLLWTAYAVGRDAIAAGNRDSWTASPVQVARAQSELKQRVEAQKKTTNNQPGTELPSSEAPVKPDPIEDFHQFFRDPGERDPRGYIITAAQADFVSATRFVNSLIENGVKVLRATNAFHIAGQTYPSGSFAVPCNQAFRAHVLDAFEPQHHPDDLQYPGGPPIAPYDIAGWTFAMQMGINYDRIWEPVAGPFIQVREVQKTPPGKVIHTSVEGYFLRADANDAFRAVNRAQAAGIAVHRLKSAITNVSGIFPAGAFYLPSALDIPGRLQEIAVDTGVTFIGGPAPGLDRLLALKRPRVGLWDRYGGSMTSGWTRWVLEQFEFPFEVVFPPTLDAGNLRDQYDVLIFVAGAVPARSTNAPPKQTTPSTAARAAAAARKKDEGLPPEYRGRQGSITERYTIPHLGDFAEAGGVILAIGTSTSLAQHLNLPLENHLVEAAGQDAKRKEPKVLSREKFYIPGSVIRARVDTQHPLGWGLGDQVDLMFVNSPVFRPVQGEAPAQDQSVCSFPSRVAWFDDPAPLRSGWSVGQSYLQDGWAVIEAKVGAGSVALFGPEIAFRGQSHGTFRFLFNGILNAGAAPMDAILAGN
jgi:hypothetical protein